MKERGDPQHLNDKSQFSGAPKTAWLSTSSTTQAALVACCNFPRQYAEFIDVLLANEHLDRMRGEVAQCEATTIRQCSHDLLRSYPAAPMRMWPISTRVNKPENDDPSILQPIELSAA